MNHADPNFVLDANVFIQAYRRYYSFDICPGFWDSLLHHAQAGRLCSIDRVHKELLAGGKGDALENWVKSNAPDTFFVTTQAEAVARHYAEIMQWVVQEQPQFKSEAKNEFARAADGWLVAYAATHNRTVVTHEEYNPDNKKKVLIPNVCKQFNVPYINTFQMLRVLQVRFDWKAV
jgi:hypothetical protein